MGSLGSRGLEGEPKEENQSFSWPFPPLQRGDSFVTDDCSQRCTCARTEVLLCEPLSCSTGEICTLGNHTRGCFRGEPRPPLALSCLHTSWVPGLLLVDVRKVVPFNLAFSLSPLLFWEGQRVRTRCVLSICYLSDGHSAGAFSKHQLPKIFFSPCSALDSKPSLPIS